ncbi:MAG TPA: choice-of-anchor Q domain-containing protein, partial [Verrucomicrobiae bacterium]|nr:choice-of-anchor Q domain-containing protein [Verrucomicrobiae bacterium]
GGLYTAGAVLLVNCTVVANTALGGQGQASPSGNGEGGGLYNAAGGLLTLIHATVASNSASAGANGYPIGASRGGAIAAAGGAVSLRSTILASSLSASNCYGSGFVDEGHNLSSDASCSFTAPGSLNNTDPVLGPLADYGGPTPTMALLAGSPALDAADPAFCPATDQRGTARPFGAGCDIGAFESAPPYTILGQVHGFTTPASGIQIDAPSTSTSVPPDGQFVLHGFAAGTHLLSISSPECVFVPRTRSVTVGPDVVDVSFLSYRSNALVIERLSAGVVRCVFAGEDGATYHVLSATNLPGLTPYSTKQAQSNGLFEFMEGTAGASRRFFQVVRP